MGLCSQGNGRIDQSTVQQDSVTARLTVLTTKLDTAESIVAQKIYQQSPGMNVGLDILVVDYD